MLPPVELIMTLVYQQKPTDVDQSNDTLIIDFSEVIRVIGSSHF